jgi:hypothetical protein
LGWKGVLAWVFLALYRMEGGRGGKWGAEGWKMEEGVGLGWVWRVEGWGGGNRGVDLLRDSPDYVLQPR